MSFARKQQFPLQSEAAIRSCSSKQMFSLVLQNSQENICVGVSFLIKMFSLRNFKNIFFTDHLLATAPVEACIDSVNSKSVFIVSLFRILEQLTIYFFKKLCYRSLTGSLIPLCFFLSYSDCVIEQIRNFQRFPLSHKRSRKCIKE